MRSNDRHETLKTDLGVQFDLLENRVKVLEDDVDALKKRPVATGGGNVQIDYNILCSKDEYLDLRRRMESTEKRNIE